MGEGLLYDTDINEMKDKKYYIVCHVDLYILLPTLNKIYLLLKFTYLPWEQFLILTVPNSNSSEF
jgi:hypothetical protein